MRTKTPGNQNSHHDTSSNERRLTPEQQLRQQAEARLFEWEKLLPEPLNLERSRRLLRELRVHQIELEIQNEELRRSQEELEASRSRYRDLYNYAPVGYITINEIGLIIEANLTAADLLQEMSTALVGQPISRFILPDDQDVYYHHRAAIFETQERQSCKLRVLRKDHPPFWARLETVPTVEKGADHPTCRIMLSDISKGMKSAEKTRLLEERNRQQKKTESLERMAAAIAHYFNNKLTIVIGNLELTVDDLPKDTNTRDYVIAAMEGAEKAAEMSSSMLTYLGQASASHKPVDLTASARSCVEKLRPSIPTTINLTVDFPADGVIVNANADQIRQVVNNLVTNAWESQAGGEGSVQVRIELIQSMDIPEKHRFPVDWQAMEGLYACLEVTDSGCGLDTAEIGQIFDPFYTSKFIGRGLGLPLVMGIVRAHHGVITVTAKTDGGSVFSVFFPLFTGLYAKTISTPPQTNISRSRATTEGTTILVVDDEPTILLIARAALGRIGFEVLTADSGNEAVEIFRQHREKISCVLCDLSMPGMDGWETLSALRRLDPDIVFILSSGYSRIRAMAGDHAELPQSFLGKPYDLNELQQKIGEVVGNSKKDDRL
jgi:two-component system, cell cycle sensor histidine kinase and response regulator CckA